MVTVINSLITCRRVVFVMGLNRSERIRHISAGLSIPSTYTIVDADIDEPIMLRAFLAFLVHAVSRSWYSCVAVWVSCTPVSPVVEVAVEVVIAAEVAAGGSGFPSLPSTNSHNSLSSSIQRNCCAQLR